MKTMEIEVTTANKNGLFNVEKDGKKTIAVTFDVTVPESYGEASEYFGGEEKLLDSIQADVARRKGNAARPILRDADRELDWEKIAQSTAESYVPGRRAGPQAIDADELEEVSGDTDALIELLRSKGYAINVAA